MRLRNGRFGAALVTVAAGAALLAPSAQADFVDPFTSECSGGDIQGQGATFQDNAQAAWRNGFINGTPGLADPVCQTFGFPSTHAPVITYGSTGSGAGRTAFQNRTADRYAGVDEPPSSSQETAIENGAAGTQDDAQLRTLPVTSGAITVSVNFPDGCTIPTGIAYRPNADGTTRFAVSNNEVEALWYGDYATWGDFIPGIGGAGCDTRPLKRVVRLDSSGTTFAFKGWLQELNPDRVPSWQSFRSPSTQNTVWPNDTGATAVVRGDGVGNQGVAKRVRENDGHVGYIDLATARDDGFDKTGRRSNLNGTDTTPPNDTTYWLPLQNGSGQFRDPTASSNSYREPFATATRGANCATVTYANVPGGSDPTLGNWFNTEGANSPTGYGVCTLTYVLTWEDYCDAYVGTGSNPEQAKARSVFDFTNYITGSAGQTVAQRADYSRLPGSLQTIAANGAAVESWQRPGNTCS